MNNNLDKESSPKAQLEPPNAPRVTQRKGGASHIAMMRKLREQQSPLAATVDTKLAWSEEGHSTNEQHKTSPVNSRAKASSIRPKSADRERRKSFCDEFPMRNPKVVLFEMDEAKLEKQFKI